MNKSIPAPNRFYTAKEIADLLTVSTTTAYRIIKQLNDELKEQGYIIVPGKIGRNYFESKIVM